MVDIVECLREVREQSRNEFNTVQPDWYFSYFHILCSWLAAPKSENSWMGQCADTILKDGSNSSSFSHVVFKLVKIISAHCACHDNNPKLPNGAHIKQIADCSQTHLLPSVNASKSLNFNHPKVSKYKYYYNNAPLLL